MQPHTRPAVAKTWARLIKPGGQLITLIFPVNGMAPDLGPPFPGRAVCPSKKHSMFYYPITGFFMFTHKSMALVVCKFFHPN